MIALLAGGIYLALWPLAWTLIHGEGPSAGVALGPLPLFGGIRLWAASFVLALPFAVAVGRYVKVTTRGGVALTVLAGLILPWMLLGGLELIEALWSFTGADQALRMLGRPVAAAVMLLPWAVLARQQVFPKEGGRSILFACLLLACIPPALYALRLTQLQREKLRGQMDRNLVVPTLESIAILGQLSGWGGEEGKRNSLERMKLTKVAEQFARLVAQPLSDDAPDRQKWEHAIAWVRLGQPMRAQAILGSLAEADPMALLFAASLDRFDGRWPQALTRYEELLNRPTGTYSSDDRYAIHEGLAEALQGLGRFAELSALWEGALIEFPAKAGTIRFNLAMAEASRGRYRQALNELDAAQVASPSMKEPIEKQRRRILANTSACFIKPF